MASDGRDMRDAVTRHANARASLTPIAAEPETPVLEQLAQHRDGLKSAHRRHDHSEERLARLERTLGLPEWADGDDITERGGVRG